MLPTPISAYSKRRDSAIRPRTRTLDSLRAPSRLTNLAALLLVSFAAVSVLLNFKHWLSPHYANKSRYCDLDASNAAVVERPPFVGNLTHLIVVPGHGIWTGAHDREVLDESSWILAPYQRGRGRPEIISEHISRGAELAVKDRSSLLVFSGGQTSPLSTTTEAESYHRLALAASALLVDPDGTPFPRATTEPYALDSYQNLLFSVARFREYTGRYPTHITIVGYEFKRRRFETLHRTAMRWPLAKFNYIGLPLRNQVEEQEASAGEVRSLRDSTQLGRN
ncbi:hypothetical protein EWM64_g5441 [Hericium alpestre]|uniref:DUF218 domain-containing protein n=1 Tax=Hericium alpestre TaxID=135208 RepID=A0A4Y9ZX28_9AGAM|nr:hypothetical protein EWM64_g5441 [Hericium alpestre]